MMPFFRNAPKGKPPAARVGEQVPFRSRRSDAASGEKSIPDLPEYEQESDLFRRALRREAVTNIADDRHLVDGRWIARDKLRRERTRRFFRALVRSIEKLLAWAILGLIGIGLMAVINLII